jgi:hypothetical protein
MRGVKELNKGLVKKKKKKKRDLRGIVRGREGLGVVDERRTETRNEGEERRKKGRVMKGVKGRERERQSQKKQS